MDTPIATQDETKSQPARQLQPIPPQRAVASLSFDEDPDLVIASAQKKAGILQEIVDQRGLSVKIGDSKHLRFEAWQTIGAFYGVIPSTQDVDPVWTDDKKSIIGAKATAQAIKADTGEVIATASAFCMRNEGTWKTKPFQQLASMAQTRAGSKVLKQMFSWVVVLAGYDPTPAEEMEGSALDTRKRNRKRTKVEAPKPVQSDGKEPYYEVDDDGVVRVFNGFDIKGDLKSAGFHWESATKAWKLDFEENGDVVQVVADLGVRDGAPA